MIKLLQSFTISRILLNRLHANAFSTTEDLQNMTPEELCKETGLTEEESSEILETVFPEKYNLSSKQDIFGLTAYDAYVQESRTGAISTFCKNLDNILGGGVGCGKITEICGCPGTGKTQICLQLCTSVQMPAHCGGLDGEAVYIDTEGSFVIDRLEQIANGTMEVCQRVLKSTNPCTSGDNLNLEKALKGVHYFRCKDFVELISCVNVLDDFLKLHPKVSLIVVDSVSFHFRYGFEENYAVRTRLLCELSQTLIDISQQFNLAVVLTNQMTTKTDVNDKLINVPALGESWAHLCAVRLILKWNGNSRQAALLKSPSMRDTSAAYSITTHGIRDYNREENTGSLPKKLKLK